MVKQTEQTQISLDFGEHPEEREIQTSHGMPWIEVAPNAPYFVTDKGDVWTPIGQNDAITWPELKGMFLRKDIETAEAYLQMLTRNGVTCLRLMMEYCHGENRYFESPVGRFQPNMVKLWDDLFALCEKYRMRILLTPYDTFWMWKRWKYHPYKLSNGGVCNKQSEWLLNPGMRDAIKKRLAFATERWGGSGALFAWDIWNEIHPAHAGNGVEPFAGFVEDVSVYLRNTELRLHGRSHPQTVSVFGPVLEKNPLVAECAFRHPALDFASIHFYETGTIDNPKNTVDAAVSTGRLTAEALAHTNGKRPFFDSEHAPIHAFKDKHKTLSEPFDDEYFRHMQWAHFASGGAGGGMRWPNRKPHSLTAGMRRAQLALSRFLPLIRWQHFRRRNINAEILISEKAVSAFGCSDNEQAIVWLLRTDSISKSGMLNRDVQPLSISAGIPGLKHGRYMVTCWDTSTGKPVEAFDMKHTGNGFFQLPIQKIPADLAFAVRRTGE